MEVLANLYISTNTLIMAVIGLGVSNVILISVVALKGNQFNTASRNKSTAH